MTKILAVIGEEVIKEEIIEVIILNTTDIKALALKDLVMITPEVDGEVDIAAVEEEDSIQGKIQEPIKTGAQLEIQEAQRVIKLAERIVQSVKIGEMTTQTEEVRLVS
jgi:hypothetical protein